MRQEPARVWTGVAPVAVEPDIESCEGPSKRPLASGLAGRWIRVVPVAVPLANRAVAAMDQMFDALAPGRFTAGTLGNFLRRKLLRHTLRTLTPVRPTIVVRDGVHIFLAHRESPFRLLSPTPARYRW